MVVGMWFVLEVASVIMAKGINTMLVDLPINIKHFKQMTEQITVMLDVGEKQLCW